MKKRYVIPLAVYCVFVLYITLLSRNDYLTRSVEIVPLWSLAEWIKGSWANGTSIILNVALFVPLGYFLSGLINKRWKVIAACFLASLILEITQYVTFLGMADVDDLISNVIGAYLGSSVYQKCGQKYERSVVLILLAAGLVGCGYVGLSRNTPEYEKVFSFDVTIEGENIVGCCEFYNDITPQYSLYLDKQILKEKISKNQFSANIIGEGELWIQFDGHRPIPTGVFIRNGVIKYTAEDKVIEGVPPEWVLKAYNDKYDTLVYEASGKLVWLIGSDITDTVVIYHLYTDEVDKLPENRKQYEFDNRGFREEDMEFKTIGHYKVFERGIPKEYNIIAVTTGFYRNSRSLWRATFRVK